MVKVESLLVPKKNGKHVFVVFAVSPGVFGCAEHESDVRFSIWGIYQDIPRLVNFYQENVNSIKSLKIYLSSIVTNFLLDT